MAVTTLGSFPGANDKDKSARIPAAIAALNKALAGDLASVTYMRGQAIGSATAVGKDAFRRALAIYDAQMAGFAPQAPLVNPIPVAGYLPTPTFAPPAPLAPAAPMVPFPGITVISEPHPIGFDHSHDPLIHPPVAVPGGITVSGISPGVSYPVNVGSSDGGAITGPPAPTATGPSGSAPAGADFGYTAPGSAPLAPATADLAGGSGIPAGIDGKIVVLLLVGAALFFFVDAHRKGK
jgi:hypothetical protein